jgi:glyoxylase-like metal-dependent hydrolase (beta-lactamase superfamily II)
MFCRTSASTGKTSPRVVGFYEEDTGSIQYLAIDEATRTAALIDVVLNFDPANARSSTDSACEILRFAESEDVKIEWILDTHPHADHLMAAHWLKQKVKAPNAIGEKVREIAELWRDIYDMPNAFDPDRNFDRLLADGDTFKLGDLDVHVMLSPGHTLGSITYVIGDAAFVHDTFMHVDSGTARCDFPGGDAHDLYRSLQEILKLPDDTRLFVGHDYGTDTRKEPAWEATVAQHRDHNAHIGGGVSEADFVKLRQDRDRTLGLPDRMLHALQVNLKAGQVPDFFKIPSNKF